MLSELVLKQQQQQNKQSFMEPFNSIRIKFVLVAVPNNLFLSTQFFFPVQVHKHERSASKCQYNLKA